jgi:hypothetical protein
MSGMLRAVPAAVFLVAMPASAARPLNTEDASFLQDGACQLDLSVVTRSGGTRADRFVSVGFHYQTDRFQR